MPITIPNPTIPLPSTLAREHRRRGRPLGNHRRGFACPSAAGVAHVDARVDEPEQQDEARDGAERDARHGAGVRARAEGAVEGGDGVGWSGGGGGGLLAGVEEGGGVIGG